MAQKYEIDTLDYRILTILQEDARRPFLEIARKCSVSGGTIHQRVEKLKEMGILKGSKALIDYKKLGHKVTVLLGIHLQSAKDVSKVIKKLEKLPEVVEVHYTTGNYALFTKIVVMNIDHFHKFLVSKLQVISEVESTESFICLDTPIDRELQLRP
ncbi:Lrp/AsnC ligand binding domain-containing protein [Halobacteriovorax sp. GB3]|uniref:Lrp/AsnC ligand binding domain-containing protein n=1 Tax=Halobacteriovorax sp. GB3 TaxID=2719615 RepID=UPI0023608848|nr:Lrp/AsnC ligand binding domain-containing protein [Halobacteriovorax sp. GB3]MDD0854159.1 Lrp/AsnC ligand binding domain-containing protein [Halobacteriovorax sp. GB3]